MEQLRHRRIKGLVEESAAVQVSAAMTGALCEWDLVPGFVHWIDLPLIQ